MKRIITYLFLFYQLAITSCQSPENTEKESSENEIKTPNPQKPSKIESYYTNNKGNDSSSISSGTYGNGKLINGKLIPFEGKNFRYFSETSYLSDRAFVNDKVLKILLATYEELEKLYPDKIFFIMETSHQNGGHFFPHRTHQNGLSVDLMSPMLQDGKEYTELDNLGIPHYWMEFDANGCYEKDKTVTINFDLIARHLLLLDEQARKNGMKINRVHFKNDLHEELFSTLHGKKLRKKGIVFTTLSKTISEQHDDHYHVDFIPN